MDLSATTGGGFAFLLLLELAIFVVLIIAMSKILSKAGYSAWFVLLAFVPVVNIVMFLVFAFSDWPAHQELARYRQMYGGGPGGYQPPWPGPSAGYGGPADPQQPPSSWQPPPPPPPGGYPPPPPGGYPPPPPGGYAPPPPPSDG